MKYCKIWYETYVVIAFTVPSVCEEVDIVDVRDGGGEGLGVVLWLRNEEFCGLHRDVTSSLYSPLT